MSLFCVTSVVDALHTALYLNVLQMHFQGDQYWRYDSRAEVPVSNRYPQEISSVWEGIPSNINAAFQWQNGYTYFFKGQNYYRFNDKDFSVSRKLNAGEFHIHKYNNNSGSCDYFNSEMNNI